MTFPSARGQLAALIFIATCWASSRVWRRYELPCFLLSLSFPPPLPLGVNNAKQREREFFFRLPSTLQENLPYHVKNVDSNDTLYVGDEEYWNELGEIASTVIEELLKVSGWRSVRHYNNSTQHNIDSSFCLDRVQSKQRSKGESPWTSPTLFCGTVRGRTRLLWLLRSSSATLKSSKIVQMSMGGGPCLCCKASLRSIYVLLVQNSDRPGPIAKREREKKKKGRRGERRELASAMLVISNSRQGPGPSSL